MRIGDAFRDWQVEGNVRRDILKLGLLAVLVAFAGVVFLFIGFFNIAASTGHWTATDLVLHSVMRQSVKFHSAGIEAPPVLDDAGYVQAGAGHFEAGCAPCHGSPAARRNPVVRGMTPHPPDLAETVPTWEAGNLFWIVKHGVKFTGMPAWPVQRHWEHGGAKDPEIWAVVAFLQRLPGMEPAEYERLALGPLADDGAEDGAGLDATDRDGAGLDATARLRGLSEPLLPVVRNCARCHGFDGKGRGSAVIPRLDLQTPAYLAASLRAYADGTRPSGMMQLQASGLDEAEISGLADYFAGRTAAEPDAGASFLPTDLVAAGRRLAEEGDPARKIPACQACHGAEGDRRKPIFPLLAGQRREYLEHQLELWHEEKRGGTPYAHLMEAVARNLEEEDISALAAFYTSLPPARD